MCLAVIGHTVKSLLNLVEMDAFTDSRSFLIFLSLSIILFTSFVSCNEGDKVEVEDSKLEYAKGSVCGYCDYCKFCKLCERDCPCEKSASKPNCDMCKYCKYCNLCSAVCDTICQPGGILDKVSAAIVNALPSYDKEEVNKDIDSVKDWINDNKHKSKEEL